MYFGRGLLTIRVKKFEPVIEAAALISQVVMDLRMTQVINEAFPDTMQTSHRLLIKFFDCGLEALQLLYFRIKLIDKVHHLVELSCDNLTHARQVFLDNRKLQCLIWLVDFQWHFQGAELSRARHVSNTLQVMHLARLFGRKQVEF